MIRSHCSSIRKSRQSVGRSPTGSAQIKSSHVSLTKHETASITSNVHGQMFITTAKYKGDVVAVKPVRKPRVKVDRVLLLEMRTMTNLKHANLASFTGACVEPQHLCEVWEYCAKGSLQDIIWNENFKLDLMFKFSMAADMLKGLKYLHHSSLKVHGRLKSSNVVVDGRCQCKLTDYGLDNFLDGQEPNPEVSEYKKNEQLFWSAPEVVRTVDKDGNITLVTVEADMYAAAVILKEIFARNGPYTEVIDQEDLTPREIINRVSSSTGVVLFRPSLSGVKSEAPGGVLGVIKAGWAERPADRPTAGQMLRDLQRHNPSKSTNVMNNMIELMEKYSNHLEELVGERTQQVDEEKRKSENLLYKMLPKPIAEDLRLGRPVSAESFEAVTIYFSDICKFTNLSAASTPIQVVDLLNGLYTVFDSAIAEHDVYKVETIGDAYMVVSGLPVRNGDNHAVEIANTAMDLLSGITDFKVKHMPDYVLRIRIGLHTGPTVAGVVGLTMPRYCLFGNTVNVASQFEAGGAPMRIHLSETTYKILSKYSGYYLADRGTSLDCKKSGKLHSYWLYGREGRNKPMPDFDELAKDDEPKMKKLPVTKGRVFRSSVTRPSEESGIFDVDTDDMKMSRKSSTNEEKLGGVPDEKEENTRTDDVMASNGDVTTNNGNVTTSNGDVTVSNGDVTASTDDVRASQTAPPNGQAQEAFFVPTQNAVFPPANAALGLKREKTLDVQDL